MPLDQNDERIIRAIFRDELEETKVRVQTIHQTVYGSDGNGGMRAEVLRHDNEIGSLKIFRTMLKTAFMTIIPALQLAITVFVEWVKAKLS